MIKKIVTGTMLVSKLAINAFAYDTNKAKDFYKFYSNFTQQACAKSKLYIDGEETMKMMHEKKKFTFLDIRTQGEFANDFFINQNISRFTGINMSYSGGRRTSYLYYIPKLLILALPWSLLLPFGLYNYRKKFLKLKPSTYYFLI